MLQRHLDAGTDYVEAGIPMVYGREAFRANRFYDELADWELGFVRASGKVRTPVVQGDELEVASRLFKKYLKLSKEYYAGNAAADEVNDGNLFENLGVESGR